MTRKLPSFQFYPDDWVQDTKALTLKSKGAWIDLLCYMWRAKERGKITMPLTAYSRLFGCDDHTAQRVIDELTERDICTNEGNSNGDVTLICRRMVREENEREHTKKRVGDFRMKRDCNAKVTSPSSSSSSSSSSKPIQKHVDVRFEMPTPQEVTEYAKSIQFVIDGQTFVDFYSSKGWMIGKNHMKDWKACVRTWKRNNFERGGNNGTSNKIVGAAAVVPGKYDHLG